MAEEESGGIQPGKLQDLKKMFEEKNAQAADSAVSKILGGLGRSVMPVTPPKTIPGTGSGHPRPAPRQNSPARKGMATSEEMPMNSMGGDTLLSYCTVPRPRKRTSSASKSKEQESFSTSTLDRKSNAQKKLSPTVSRRIAMFSSENGVKEDDADQHDVVERRFLSSSAKSRNSKRLSDPCSDTDSSHGRKNSAERRRTVDNFSLTDTDSKPAEVRVQDKVRMFQEKPSLPKKPVIQPAPPGSSVQKMTAAKPSEQTEQTDSYEIPWDLKPGTNVELLKALSREQQLPHKVMLPLAESPCSAVKDSKGGGKSGPHRLKPLSRPTEQPPPPPSKPPRTFVHSEYLESKVASPGVSSSDSQTGPQLVRVIPPGEGSSIDGPDVTLRVDGGSPHPSTSEEARETKGIREKPPSRPPPPRPRPISEVSTLNRRHASPRRTGGVKNTEEEQGPVVISLRTGRPISRPVSRQVSMVDSHRKPNDQLPDRPERDSSIHRFPLRKSYSSECLYQGSVSSLSDMGSEEEETFLSKAVMMQSYHPGDSGEPIYEALIDSDGYAVPNQFVRGRGLPLNNQVTKGGGQALTRGGFLKRFLNPSSSPTVPALPATTPIKDQDVEKVSAKKMNLVKQKINQAYEALQVVFRGPSVSEEVDQDNLDPLLCDEPESTDADSIVDPKEIEERVHYCSTIRQKTVKSVKKTWEFMDQIYPQLFEYALIVGLIAKTDNPGYEPAILHKFPQTVESNMSVPKFCFPDADEFRPGTMTSTSESYSFVLTDEQGNRMYGYCRRLQPHDASLPEVICIISPIDASNMYNQLLTEVEKRRFKSLDHAQELMAASFGRPMPKPGKVCHIRALDENGDMETILLLRPCDPHLSNVNYESLLLYLGTEKLIKVFASMLMERRLILCSKQLSALTQTIHALVALLYPFQWQHVYVPLLPPDMIDVCASPTPFIIGVLTLHLPKVLSLELEDMIVVDLDSRQVLRSVGDELTLLPRKVQKALKTAINMCRIDSDAQHSQWLMVSEAFLRMFLETIGHFSQHIMMQQDNTNTFMKEQFIQAAASKGIRQFLMWFTETQMFDVFCTTAMDRTHWGSLDLFLSRLTELQKKRQADSTSAVKGIGQKVKNLGKAIKTKLKE